MYDILNEFIHTNLMLRDTAVPALELYISSLSGRPGSAVAPAAAAISSADQLRNIMEAKPILSTSKAIYADFWADDPFENAPEGAVAIIPLAGIMQKRSAWTWNGYKRGIDEIANIIRLADQNPDISGTIILMNTPGGATDAIIQIEDALRNRTKPAVTLIEYDCCSGGMYVASLTDEIYAINPMCTIGSIGIYITLIDETKIAEAWGLKLTVIYPPESKYKNLEVREALEGKPQRIIKEILTPFAIHFQNIVKTNRPNLDLKEEGIIEGRVFYAKQAVQNGLIDGIKNLDQTIDRVIQLAANNLNNINKQTKKK